MIDEIQKFMKVKERMEAQAKSYAKKQTLDFLKIIDHSPDDFSGLQPFVFTSEKLPDSARDMQDVPAAPEGAILASPFELFSVELEDIALTASEVVRESELAVNIQAVICKETAPNEFIFWINQKVTSFDGRVDFIITKSSPQAMTVYDDRRQTEIETKKTIRELYKSIFNIVYQYIERLHNEKTGTFDARGRAKTKVNGKKTIYKPKGVIYVTPFSGKKYQARTLAQGTQKIKWNDAWTCRAHWRRLNNPETVGKDRYGERTVKGYTWIDSHTKGEGKLATKIRRVK